MGNRQSAKNKKDKQPTATEINKIPSKNEEVK